MKRNIFIPIAIWMLALRSLCLAGVLEHICGDCPESITCGHEENCAADPCVETLQRPDSSSGDDGRAPAVLFASGFITSGSNFPAPQFFTHASLLTDRANLPRPESDVPLLN